MAVKGFIWLIFLVIIVLFIIQNLQAVSVVFFGSTPITLPLSIWILLFALAGIFVSVIIKGLASVTDSGSSRKDNNQKGPVTTPPNPNQDSGNKPPLTKQRSAQTGEFNNFNPTYKEPFDEDFEFLTDNINSQNQEMYQDPTLSYQPQKNSFPIEDTNENLPLKETPEDKTNADLEVNQNDNEDEQINKNNNDDNVIDIKIKPRSPLPYSYKPGEKTEIRRKPQPLPEIKRPPKNEIYDANYRIIDLPSQPNKDRNSVDEDEEEWEF